MPLLNRVVTVSVEAEGTRDENGRYVPGPVTDYRVWAVQTAAGSTDYETSEGTRIAQIVRWTIRYTAEIALARTDRVTITDENGFVWDPESIAESQRRRRYLDITATRRA